MCLYFSACIPEKKNIKNAVFEGSDPVYAICQSRLCSSDKRQVKPNNQYDREQQHPESGERTVCTKQCFIPQISITKPQIFREIRTRLGIATSIALLQNKTTDQVKTPHLPFLFETVKPNNIIRLSLSRAVLHPFLSRIVLHPFSAHMETLALSLM